MADKELFGNSEQLESGHEKDHVADTGNMVGDLINRQVAVDAVNSLIDRFELILSDIRESKIDDSVCGMCEYDGAFVGQSGDWCNECPGFEKDNCFKLSDECRKRWLDSVELPSAQPTGEDIQKMQDIEQAALEKAYECGKQDAQRWIPCEERLPEPGVNVLVDVLDIPADDRFPLVDKIGDDGDWCNCYGDWFAVAWMPIPEPYKEGEK